MADDILKDIPLPADLPENWTSGQIIAPTGAEAGLDEQHGYNYLMMQVNNAQKALKVLAAQREEDRARIKFWFSPEPTSPASIFGGTWEQIKDCFILAAGDTYAAGSTGGEAEHALINNEMPRHRHEGIDIDNIYYFGWENGSSTGINFKKFYRGEYWGDDVQNRLTSGYAGGSQPHNNMPPYITMYVWKRIA